MAFLQLAATSLQSVSDENPMWVSGYEWACVQGDALICERGDTCAFSPRPERSIKILFNANSVRIGGNTFKIKRHYSQRIDRSPLADEVKIELDGNSIIWLSPVDAGRSFSTVWSGMIVEIKHGVELSVSHALFCRPQGLKTP
jgi:hypothetical protein